LHLAPMFGGQRLAEIQPDAFALYATTRREAGASAASVNRELAIVRRMFVLAMQAGKLLYRPHIPHLRERNARAGFFERATFESVYAHLPEALQPVVLFAYVTGWRIDSEVLTREWRHVDFDANEIRLDPGETKNGEPRVFPLTDDLRALLLERQAAREAAAAAGYVCPWVFFRLVAGRSIPSKSSASTKPGRPPVPRRGVRDGSRMTSDARPCGTWSGTPSLNASPCSSPGT
jgi:integrase